MMQSNKKINNKHTLFLYYFMSDRVVNDPSLHLPCIDLTLFRLCYGFKE